MVIFPFDKVTGLPTGLGGSAEILTSSDLIEVMDKFSFQTLRATDKPYYRGVTGYLFDAQICVGFDRSYHVVDVEVRNPFSCLEGEGVIWRDFDLIFSTLRAAYDVFRDLGMQVVTTDTGFDVPDIGISFFSNDYENDLESRLDAITIQMKPPV